MKKVILSLICLAIIICFSTIVIIKNNDKQDDLTTIKVAEVAHTIFYAPQYVAISQGYFADEGINIELTLTPGADKVMAAVLSNDVQIGFSGSEATIYVYQSGEKDYVKTFAGLTARDGTFLVSREKYDNFTLDDLKGKYVIGGRAGGMPEMTFEWALREAGIDPKNDLTIDTSVAFAAMEGAFIGGTGDFVTLFEPNALSVEKAGFGHVVAYIGELGGEVPYTVYHARGSYIEQNPDIIKSFSNAVQKGLDFVANNDSETIAKSIVEFFPDTSINDLTLLVERYKNGNAWKTDISITKDEWNHIQEIMIASGELKQMAPYDDLIYTTNFK
ncbi:MAG: ABC transporter substrate-binding protein [bacterium]|nr:ABC transporter substrate-binding protein [bacterium]